MSNNEIGKEKNMSTHNNFSNPWPVSLDQKHHTWKNREAQSAANQMLKNNINKKRIIRQKDLKQKMIIKRKRMKTKIRNKSNGN